MIAHDPQLAATWSARLGVQPTDEAWEIARSMERRRVPWIHLGRSERGVDCVGLLVLTAWAQGWQVQDSTYYGREPARNNNSFQLRDYLRRNLGEPVTRPLQPNDVLLMKLRPRFDPAHVGMVAPHRLGLAVIHAYGEIGRVAYQRIDQARAAQIVEVYPWPAKPSE